jgi:outer membrane protein assembly factor BamB
VVGVVNACGTVTPPPTAHLAPAVQEHQWTAYLGTAHRTGTAPESLVGEPAPAWRARPAHGLVGGPAVAEAVIALAQSDRQVALLDRATGDVLWRHRTQQPLGAGPLIAADRVYAAESGNGGRVVALRLTDGREMWSRRAGDVVAPLVLAHGAVYAGGTGGLVKVEIAEGHERWRTTLSGTVRTAPLPVAAGVIVATSADSLFFLADSNGVVVRGRRTHGTVLAAPALADSVVVFGTTAGRIEAVDARTLRTFWIYDLDEPIVGSIAVRGDTAWALSGRGVLVGLPLAGPATGARRVELGLVARAGPMPFPGGILVCAVGGEIVWLSDALERHWSARVESPLVEPPIVDGRTMIVTSQRGDVAAFR